MDLSPAVSPPSTPSTPSSADAPSALDRRERGVTPRVVIFSLVMAVVFGYALPVIDFKLLNTFLGAQHLPPGSVGTLIFLLVVANPILGKLARKWRLSRNETLTIYISWAGSSRA